MTLGSSLSRTLRLVAQRAAEEQDPEKLRQLILEINMLLDVIEKRVGEIEALGGN